MTLKKITLSAIVLFGLIILTIGALSVLFPPNPNTSTSKTPTTNTSQDGLTLDQVAAHSTTSDCYLAIRNKVYDVSSYIHLHPGGRNTITSRCGKEVTGVFASIHSNFAWNLLGKYYVAPVITSSAVSSQVPQETFTTIESALTKKYLGAEIINIKPAKNAYVAKIIYQKKLIEVHTDSSGRVTKEEVANEENDWSSWNTDSDDLK